MNLVKPSGVLYSRLSCLDPESTSKIMGFVHIHGPNEADMMSLATAPDAVLHHLISKGKNYSRVLTSSLQSPSAAATAASSSSPRQIPVPNISKASPYDVAVVNDSGGPSALFHGNGEVATEDDYAASFLSNLGGSPRSSFHKRRSLSLNDAYAATDEITRV